MASKKGQVVFATNGNSISTSATRRDYDSAITPSKEKMVARLQHASSKQMSLREQGDLSLVVGAKTCFCNTQKDFLKR